MASFIQERFRGADRAEARRNARNYWIANRERLGLTLAQFSERCVVVGRGETILFVSRELRRDDVVQA